MAIDAIGLFESGLAQLCTTTVAVLADPQIRVARLMPRDNISEEYAKSRIAAQPDNAHFESICDHILENNGTAENFREICLAFLQTLGIL